DRDGKIHVPIGSGNIGTANHTAISLIVAEALRVPVDDLVVTWGGSSDTAWDFVTDASRSVHCHGKAMLNAALDLKRQLNGAGIGSLSVGEGGRKGFVARVPVRTDFTPYYDPRLDISPLLDESTGEIKKHPTPELNPPTLKMAKKILAEGGVVGLGYYIWNPAVQAWGASFAEVEVDMETGQVQVLKLVGAHDCGRIIHRTGAEAQVHGGMIMGLGYGATEELPLDPNNGMPVYQTLYEYRPPSILDMPTLVPILVEAPVEAGPYGAKGLGENPMFDAAAPVVNAIYNATGVYVREIPVTPYRVYQALKEAGKLMTREA
ncbi:MAG TPA: molybdopterin cofactor-binding domain-containing protein, partial [Longimicrobiaceae bacterium]|nr:molybdopterin cofactor-binding domain-containing protein [Longimicrobiaceae bacterium]